MFTGALDRLYSSMNSSLSPLGPRTRNSLMTIDELAARVVSDKNRDRPTSPIVMADRNLRIEDLTGGGRERFCRTFRSARSSFCDQRDEAMTKNGCADDALWKSAEGVEQFET